MALSRAGFLLALLTRYALSQNKLGRKGLLSYKGFVNREFNAADEALAGEGLVRAVGSLEKDDIGVVFQPIVDLCQGETYASECLVRCQVKEYASPPDLFAAASCEKVVGELGRLIREVAFENVPTDRLFVNLHPEELQEQWMVRPDDPLFAFDGQLFLEVTETTAITQFDLCNQILHEVATRTGARLVIDDLGAGYSNLGRVVDFDPAVVKLDQRLITGIDKNPRKEVLVRGIVALCSELNADVVAEGIETESELRVVQSTGARFGQGYYFARPAFPMIEVSVPFFSSCR